jgi:2-keto-4-pentenoate hydratase
MGVAEMADALWRAERERAPIAPLTDTHVGLGIAEGYAIQAHNVARRVAGGATVRGRKLGLTSRRTQQLLGVDEPTFGVLTDDMLVDDGAELSPAELVAPRVEAELAFVLDGRPGRTRRHHGGRAQGDRRRAARARGRRQPGGRVARAHRRHRRRQRGRREVVLGRSTPVEGLDLRLLGVLLSRNGTPIDSGAGAAALGHPAAALGWLANTLAGFGEGLRRGDVVLAGALTRMVPARPGDRFSAEFAHLGTVSVRFGAP